MPLPITALYAGLLTIFALFLSFRAGGFRGKTGISLLYGDPVNWELVERVRAHQNFVEYVPLVVILMGIIEVGGGSAWVLHGIGILLIIARAAHMVGLKQGNIGHPGRAIGAGGTALISLVAALYAIWLAFASLAA